MRNLVLALSALSLAVPATIAVPAASAASVSVAKSELQRGNNYRYREWRGRDGRTYCRKSDGTTGLVVGAVGGALVGRTIDTRGDRTGGTVLGAVAGALAGREIDRSNSNNRRRCR
jgi:outer membrane lipoprotein SlyB